MRLIISLSLVPSPVQAMCAPKKFLLAVCAATQFLALFSVLHLAHNIPLFLRTRVVCTLNVDRTHLGRPTVSNVRFLGCNSHSHTDFVRVHVRVWGGLTVSPLPLINCECAVVCSAVLCVCLVLWAPTLGFQEF